MEDLLALSDRVQAQMALINGKKICHGCGTTEGVSSRCGRCGFAWYCGKVGLGHEKMLGMVQRADKHIDLGVSRDWLARKGSQG